MDISQLDNITEAEAEQISLLSSQLGYENKFDLLFERLKQILLLQDHAVFVARIDDKIVGWLHCLICIRVESPIFVEVTGLVIDENIRGRHIGKSLIEASKAWSRSQDISKIYIRCNTIRKESHKFYEALGFSSIKEQKVFQIAL